MRRRGVTLIELLLSLAIVLFVTVSAARALGTVLNYDNRLKASRDVIVTRQQFEDRIRFLIRHAWLSTTTGDANSYFIAGTPSLTPSAPGLAGQSGTPTGSNTGGQNSANGDPSQLTFTVGGLRLSSAELASNDDFETNNQNFGPQGGIQEVSIETTAVGSIGQGMTGCFLRTQIPADDDPTQGGNEVLLTSELTELGFEMYDGTTWQTSWDTRSQTGAGELPAAVKVTYRFTGDTVDNIFIVQLPESTATSTNPVTVPG